MSPNKESSDRIGRAEQRQAHARAIAAAGSLEEALRGGGLLTRLDTTLSEAILLGLLKQQVNTFFSIFGHGSTEIGEVLRIYQEAGLVRVYHVHNEIEASHAAAALRWITGQKAAVITSIGPGALQALAASIVPASDGIGVWYLFGDETSEDEGPNMQQIPRQEQGLFLRLCATMGDAYSLHTPQALPAALRRGMLAADHPYRARPFFLLLPMNTQPASLPEFNLAELPGGAVPGMGAAEGDYERAAALLLEAQKVIFKLGGGARQAGAEIVELLDLVDGVAVTSPIAGGAIPYAHPRCMAVGGSKGSLCGNYAMENADLLLAIGTRSVCQSDCSRTGYPNVKNVININADLETAVHYQNTLALVGDARLTLRRLISAVRRRGGKTSHQPSAWLRDCAGQKHAWQALKARRYQNPCLYDERRKETVLTQPAAIKTALDWARANDFVTVFDAGDVQANGFQVVEDDLPGRTYTETGASYMGFAVSSILASAASHRPLNLLAVTGDGSFLMNPQVLVDGVEHGARGCILLLDNHCMGAIAGLQQAQYGTEFAVSDSVEVDYIRWAGSVRGVQAIEAGRSPGDLQAALEQALQYQGLSLVHVPVYFGPHELGGMGVYGRWNVGIWSEEVQALRHQIGL